MKYQAYPDKGNWYKGNIHSHTTLSDGSVEPMEQIRLYESLGYDFLAFTDHNVMNSRPEWNTGRMLMIPGWERDISYEYKIKCTHLVGLFPPDIPAEASKRLPAGDKDLMTDQMLINEMRKDNVFISIAHPAWSRMEPDELLALTGYDAVEVYNMGTECLCHEGHNEYIWDMLLRHGHKVLGIACDDTHSHTERDDHFGGWIMVKAESLTKDCILSAMLRGEYYSTMGPDIISWKYEDGYAEIACSPADEIHFITYPARGKAFFGKDLCGMRYQLKGGEKYIRAEVIDSEGRRAWTNPFYFD